MKGKKEGALKSEWEISKARGREGESELKKKERRRACERRRGTETGDEKRCLGIKKGDEDG